MLVCPTASPTQHITIAVQRAVVKDTERGKTFWENGIYLIYFGVIINTAGVAEHWNVPFYIVLPRRRPSIWHMLVNPKYLTWRKFLQIGHKNDPWDKLTIIATLQLRYLGVGLKYKNVICWAQNKKENHHRIPCYGILKPLLCGLLWHVCRILWLSMTSCILTIIYCSKLFHGILYFFQYDTIMFLWKTVMQTT